jgi:hypothetical protein
MAAMYGGTILTPGPISDEGLATYLKSVARFKDATSKAKVEIVMQNHPLMDPVQPKLERCSRGEAAIRTHGSWASRTIRSSWT